MLHREKFHFQEVTIRLFLDAIKQFGREVFPTPTGEILVDQDDLIFYEVAMERQQDDAYLVTGNLRHYPVREFSVTPAQMMEILEGSPWEGRKEERKDHGKQEAFRSEERKER